MALKNQSVVDKWNTLVLDQRAHLNRKVRFGVGRYDRPSHASIMPAPPLQ
jgi:hypothetical protein